MHELNIMLEVVRQVSELAAENQIEKVDAIVLQIGELAPVVPFFIKDYYSLMVENEPALIDSEVQIETIECTARCNECETIFPVVPNRGYCPHCHSFDKTILTGQEFIVKEIIVPAEQIA